MLLFSKDAEMVSTIDMTSLIVKIVGMHWPKMRHDSLPRTLEFPDKGRQIIRLFSINVIHIIINISDF